MKNQENRSASAAQSAPHSFNISRRAFLQRCGLLAAATGLPLWFVERQQLAAAEPVITPTPNDRPGIALVGCGGMGKVDAANASRYGDILAVCDVDDNHAAALEHNYNPIADDHHDIGTERGANGQDSG